MESNQSNRGVELLNISIDIGNGASDTLRIFEHDDPQVIIRNFYIKNTLSNNDTEGLLLGKVYALISELVEEHKLLNMTLATRPVMSEKPCKNYGEKLYRRGMQEKEHHLVVSQMKRINSAKQIQETVIGRPKLNKNSIRIASNAASKANSVMAFHTPKSSSTCEMTFKFEPQSDRPDRKSMSKIDFSYHDIIDKKKNSETVSTSTREWDSPIKVNIGQTKSPIVKMEMRNKIITCKSPKTNGLGLKQHLFIDVDPKTGNKFFRPTVEGSPKKTVNKVVQMTDLAKHQKRSSCPGFPSSYETVKIIRKLRTEKVASKTKLQVL
ncbi:hypothetical protein SteCoe_34474 [Stentor coeruleus]|uniref:Uncharacterized protein n=1 Tax=Stentor coeruleus TaxID=5963 RepID=A0A1R2AUF0_9CILI|nr:hypothetical protein SteCoe_34474 [Stentor coeruleus]